MDVEKYPLSPADGQQLSSLGSSTELSVASTYHSDLSVPIGDLAQDGDSGLHPQDSLGRFGVVGEWQANQWPRPSEMTQSPASEARSSSAMEQIITHPPSSQQERMAYSTQETQESVDDRLKNFLHRWTGLKRDFHAADTNYQQEMDVVDDNIHQQPTSASSGGKNGEAEKKMAPLVLSSALEEMRKEHAKLHPKFIALEQDFREIFKTHRMLGVPEIEKFKTEVAPWLPYYVARTEYAAKFGQPVKSARKEGRDMRAFIVGDPAPFAAVKKDKDTPTELPGGYHFAFAYSYELLSTFPSFSSSYSPVVNILTKLQVSKFSEATNLVDKADLPNLTCEGFHYETINNLLNCYSLTSLTLSDSTHGPSVEIQFTFQVLDAQGRISATASAVSQPFQVCVNAGNQWYKAEGAHVAYMLYTWSGNKPTYTALENAVNFSHLASTYQMSSRSIIATSSTHEGDTEESNDASKTDLNLETAFRSLTRAEFELIFPPTADKYVDLAFMRANWPWWGKFLYHLNTHKGHRRNLTRTLWLNNILQLITPHSKTDNGTMTRDMPKGTTIFRTSKTETMLTVGAFDGNKINGERCKPDKLATRLSGMQPDTYVVDCVGNLHRFEDIRNNIILGANSQSIDVGSIEKALFECTSYSKNEMTAKTKSQKTRTSSPSDKSPRRIPSPSSSSS